MTLAFDWKALGQGTISKFTSELPACFVVLQQQVTAGNRVQPKYLYKFYYYSIHSYILFQ